MREHVAADEHIIAAQKNLGHYIGFVSIILDVGFHAQVIKTIGFRDQLSACLLEGCFGVFVDNRIAVLDEFQSDITSGFDDVLFFGCKHEAKQGHQGGFATTDRTSQQDALVEVNAVLFSIGFVLIEVDQKFEYNQVVFLPYPEFWTSVGFACFLQEFKAFVELDDVASNTL